MHSDTTPKWLLLAVTLALCLAMVASCDRSPQESALVSTFNVELYPKHEDRAAALFPEIDRRGRGLQLRHVA